MECMCPSKETRKKALEKLSCLLHKSIEEAKAVKREEEGRQREEKAIFVENTLHLFQDLLLD